MCQKIATELKDLVTASAKTSEADCRAARDNAKVNAVMDSSTNKIMGKCPPNPWLYLAAAALAVAIATAVALVIRAF